MKICIFVTEAKYPINVASTISGHVQLALFTANILKKHGHEVTLITNKAPVGYQLPSIASKALRVNTIVSIFKRWPNQGIKPLKIPLCIYELRKIILSSGFDIIHFFGTNRMAYLLGLLKIMKIPNITFMTFHNFSAPRTPFTKLLNIKLLKKINVLITLTNYTKMQILQSSLSSVIDENKVIVMHLGVEKQPTINKNKSSLISLISKRYVLFWRNANRKNGADICAEAFIRISGEYPDIDFVFAIRPGDEYDEKLLKISRTYKNIQLLCYPYKGIITIADLLAGAAVVVLPFRKLSINPQFAVLETLASGVSLITTPVESNKEIIEHRQTGILASPSADEIAAAIRELLDRPSFARQIGINGRKYVRKEWNWKNYEEKLIKLYEDRVENK